MGRLGRRIKLFLTFATGVIECLGFAGVIFGWPSLVFVLRKDEYFADLCPPGHNSSRSVPRNGSAGCLKQNEQFSLVFTIANFVTDFFTFGNGILLDNSGMMATRFLAILLYTAGTLMISFSTAASALLLFPACALIGMGGAFFLTTNLKVGNLFGTKRSTVITVYSGSFSSAAAVFLVVKVAYEAGFSLRTIFLFISCLSVLHVLRTVFLLPWKHVPYPLPQRFTYGVNCEMIRLLSFWREAENANQRKPHRGAIETGGDGNERRAADAGEGRNTGDVEEECQRTEGGRGETESEEVEAEGATREGRGEAEGAEEERRAEVETVEEKTEIKECSGDGMEAPAGREEAEVIPGDGHELPADGANLPSKGTGGSDVNVNEGNVPSFRNCVFSRLFLTSLLWFSMMQLRIVFFLGTLNPLLNLLTDGDVERGSAAFRRLADMQSAVPSLTIAVTVSVLFSLSAAIPFPELQYLTFVLLMISRSFLYGSLSAFLAMTFPPRHFGKLYGITRALTAVVTLLQYPFFIIVNGPSRGNPLYMNIAFIALVALAYAHPINVYFFCRRESRRRGV